MLSGFNPQEIQDLDGARQAITALLNLVEELREENQALRAEVQNLRDEVNRLKGEQGQPNVKANKGKDNDHSSEKERHKPKQWRKGSKVDRIQIDREELLEVDKCTLPADAEFKGFEETVVQDIRLVTDNIRFVKEKYYSPSQGCTYLAPLPAGYSGQFGPGVRSWILTLYYASGMTEPKIKELLGHIGIFISAGQVSNLLIKEQEQWHEEKEAVWQAGLASTGWQHIDDTSTRVNGENQHCHIVCNPLYSAYFTRPGKDRLTVIQLLQGGDSLDFLLNQQTASWLDLFNTPMWVQQQMANWPQGQVLTRDQMDELLTPDIRERLNDQQQARILEAAALSAYHEQNETPVISILLSDDASQFQHITQLQALCWIHEGRHYKKLIPFVEHHQQLLDGFQTQFWDFYHKLQHYREAPSSTQADRLRADFEKLFSTTTGYEALDRRIAKTRAKQGRLLVVLDHPEVPLHNNPAELAVRQRVRKRDISFGPRTSDGVAAWDTFMTLNETAKKLGVSFYAYLHDRVSDARNLPSLALLIQQHAHSIQQQMATD
jgi:FtsZ-binding cell division protein ZapB